MDANGRIYLTSPRGDTVARTMAAVAVTPLWQPIFPQRFTASERLMAVASKFYELAMATDQSARQCSDRDQHAVAPRRYEGRSSMRRAVPRDWKFLGLASFCKTRSDAWQFEGRGARKLHPRCSHHLLAPDLYSKKWAGIPCLSSTAISECMA